MTLAVQLALDLAGKEHVGLLERMVVRLCCSADLVVDGEHRHLVGAERPVDQHLHGDPAVGEDRGVRPGRGATTGGIVDAESLGLRPRAVVVADQPEGRIAERRASGIGVHAGEILRGLEERVASRVGGVASLRAVEREEADRFRRRVPERMAETRRDQREVTRDEPVDAAAEVEQELAAQDVERLFERVDVGGQPSARAAVRPTARSVWTAP